MSSIKQQMNFLIPCHPICSYLLYLLTFLSNQLELLLTRRLSLKIFFPVINFRSFTTISYCSSYFSNVPNRKANIFKPDWSKFNHEEFILDYFSLDWSHTLKLQNNNIDASLQNFSDSMSNILDKYAI